MNDDIRRAQAAFYETCASILDVEHEYRPWIGRPPNRWNNRRPGNGRFPGFGCVRWFGPGNIHVMLHAPVARTATVRSEAEAFSILRAAVSGAPDSDAPSQIVDRTGL